MEELPMRFKLRADNVLKKKKHRSNINKVGAPWLNEDIKQKIAQKKFYNSKTRN